LVQAVDPAGFPDPAAQVHTALMLGLQAVALAPHVALPPFAFRASAVLVCLFFNAQSMNLNLVQKVRQRQRLNSKMGGLQMTAKILIIVYQKALIWTEISVQQNVQMTAQQN